MKQKYAGFFLAISLTIISWMKDSIANTAMNKLFEKVFGIFTAFAIFVACLGLFGLTMFSTIQRTKEIGVRKVLGRIGFKYSGIAVKRFYQACSDCVPYCISDCMVGMNNWLGIFRTGYHQRMGIPHRWSICRLIALITISFQAVYSSNQ